MLTKMCRSEDWTLDPFSVTSESQESEEQTAEGSGDFVGGFPGQFSCELVNVDGSIPSRLTGTLI